MMTMRYEPHMLYTLTSKPLIPWLSSRLFSNTQKLLLHSRILKYPIVTLPDRLRSAVLCFQAGTAIKSSKKLETYISAHDECVCWQTLRVIDRSDQMTNFSCLRLFMYAARRDGFEINMMFKQLCHVCVVNMQTRNKLPIKEFTREAVPWRACRNNSKVIERSFKFTCWNWKH